LYMSLLIKQKISAETALSITTVAAVAVARAIEKHTSRKPLIKWVNDIYIDDKKVCGILTEAKTAENGIIEYAVLGIGVNLHKPKNGIDDSISDIADCVLEDDEYVANELTADIINYFYEYFGKNDYIDEYISRSYLDGRTVSFYENGALLSGRVIGIDKKCSLLVDVNGACHTLLSGEVGLISFNRK